jgi:hypothetical protein
MTEAARSKRRPGAAPVFWTSMALFCLLLGLLTYRFSIGQDPSGVGAEVSQPPVREKVIVRRVVTTVVPAGAGVATNGSGGGPPVTEAPAAPEAEAVPVSEPVTSSS